MRRSVALSGSLVYLEKKDEIGENNLGSSPLLEDFVERVSEQEAGGQLDETI